jgi:hypothetical protein
MCKLSRFAAFRKVRSLLGLIKLFGTKAEGLANYLNFLQIIAENAESQSLTNLDRISAFQALIMISCLVVIRSCCYAHVVGKTSDLDYYSTRPSGDRLGQRLKTKNR